ncbi:MAG: hypothetical protein P8074_24150 [Anaerolineales bacterium]|jgi:triacylglycerol lipase
MTLFAATPLTQTNSNGQAAILIHGLASHPLVLNGIRRRLLKLDFFVSSSYYPFMSADVDDILVRLHSAIAHVPSAYTLHFVTHSVGALMARAYISRYSPPNIGRLVMLAPPNHGTPLIDRFGDWPLFRSILGSIASQLGTRADCLPQRLPSPAYPTGIIAGKRTWFPFSHWWLPEPHDGLVPLSSTFLPTMTDHITVPYSHRVMISIPAVQQEVVHFLQTGSFSQGRFVHTPLKSFANVAH